MELVEVFGNPESRIVVSVPHSGTFIPEEIQEQLAISLEEAQGRVDTYTCELAGAAEVYATIVKANVSRTVIDVNRSGTIAELDLTTDAKDERDRLVRLYDGEGRPLWKKPLGRPYITREELEARIREYYDPYHQVLGECVERAGRPMFLVDMHSMSAPGFDMVIGDFRGRSAGVEICELEVKPFFEERGYRVGYAGPREVDRRGQPLSHAAIRYSGGFVTSRYGDPASGQHAFQIEVNREAWRRGFDQMELAFGEFFRFLYEEGRKLSVLTEDHVL